MDYDLPEKNIVEVTLIGTGGGYGESSVIHYGNNKWAIVDSCIDPNSGQCLPLWYLKKIGVNLATDVKMIICTHWHDDHILGLSQLLAECTSAEFIIGKVLDKRKFLHLVTLDYQKLSERGTTSSTSEFIECMKIMTVRKKIVRCAVVDKLLDATPELNIEIHSLSPSDYTLEQFDMELSSLITEFGVPNRKIMAQSPNDKSVVLLFNFGTHKALLGADLEVSDNNEKGWLHILDKCIVVKNKKANLFKIPHHGSHNGYNERIWLELLTERPVSKLTPWNRNSGLPGIDMLAKYKQKTDKLFITSTPKSIASKPQQKVIKRDKDFSKVADLFNIKIVEVSYNFGLVRSRVDIGDNQATWQSEVAGNGFQVQN
jgi:beta-lactamase superfamily II metal-dependent hydrolase